LSKDEARAGVAKASYLTDQILETGLEPFRRPEPLPPIRFDEVLVGAVAECAGRPGSRNYTDYLLTFVRLAVLDWLD
jgi:hypothetical protein